MAFCNGLPDTLGETTFFIVIVKAIVRHDTNVYGRYIGQKNTPLAQRTLLQNRLYDIERK